jgi:trk system potassium uptake protein TrkA
MRLFVLIVGGGKVGTSLARSMLEEGYEVALIENQRHKYEDLDREFGYAAIFGDGTETRILEKAGVTRSDYVIAVTGDDEDNIIISQLAREKYGVQNVIARVNNPRNQATFDMLGIRPTVSNVSTILSLVEHHLPHQRLLSLLDFEEENMEMVEMAVSQGAAIVGRKIKDLRLPPSMLLVLIFREHEVVIPSGDVELRADDNLIIIAEKGQVSALGGLMGGQQRINP